uniref:Transmembrane protein n=1 Tax=Fusarium oxysporum (strain Fo5176) TaxID=660025 RepID=A0A0D2Y864_FUSOF
MEVDSVQPTHEQVVPIIPTKLWGEGSAQSLSSVTAGKAEAVSTLVPISIPPADRAHIEAKLDEQDIEIDILSMEIDQHKQTIGEYIKLLEERDNIAGYRARRLKQKIARRLKQPMLQDGDIQHCAILQSMMTGLKDQQRNISSDELASKISIANFILSKQQARLVAFLIFFVGPQILNCMILVVVIAYAIKQGLKPEAPQPQ